MRAALAPPLLQQHFEMFTSDNDDNDDDVDVQQQQLVCCGFSFGKGGEIIEIRNNVHKSNEIATKALPTKKLSVRKKKKRKKGE